MSTSQLQTDYLTCCLCGNPYNQPKTLPCLHSFCKKCLSKYLEEQMSGGKHTTFTCPDCGIKIYVPDPSKAVNLWAAQFPTNFTLTGMIESIGNETDSDSTSSAKDRTDNGDESNESLGNRSVDIVAPVDEKGDTKQSDLQTKIQTAIDRLQTEVALLTDQSSGLKQKKKQEIEKTDMSFRKVVELIECRREQLILEISSAFDEEEDKIHQYRQIHIQHLDSLKGCSELLNTFRKQSLGKGVAKDVLSGIENQLSQVESRPVCGKVKTIKFEQTLEAGRSILKLIEDLGNVTISTNSDVNVEDGVKVKTGSESSYGIDESPKRTKLLNKPKFVTAISSKYSGKSHKIYDVTVMNNGVVVWTTHGEKFIQAAKAVGDQKYEIFSLIELDTEVKGIATLSPFYVCAVGSSCLYLVAVTDKLALKQQVNTGKDYRGIDCYGDSSLILASSSPPSVDFVGLNGFISETIDKDRTTGSILFKMPQFVARSPDGMIYVTDASAPPRVLAVNNAGKINFRFPPTSDKNFLLEAPQGVCCDSQGHVYIVDKAAKKVILLNTSGEKVKDLLTADDGLTNPCSVTVDKNDCLYVTNDFSEVLVFKVQ